MQKLYNLRMALTLDWLHLIALLAAIQGVFLGFVLATKRSNRTANRLLAVAMLAFSIDLATAVYHATGFERVLPHFFGLAYPLPLLYGPIIFLYAITAADRNRGLTRFDALHFLPVAAVIVAGLPIYLMSGAEKIDFYHRLQHGERTLLLQIADPLKFVSGAIYATATIVFLQRHRERVKESYSSTERVNLRWLFWLGCGAAVVWFLAIASQLGESAGVMRVGRGDDIVTLAIAVLVYGIGYMGLRQPEVFRYETAEYPVQVVTDAPEETEEPAPRYERSGLTDRQAARLKDALTTVMEKERPWRDADLTLADLAARLSTTPHKLSEVLNAQLGLTFYDFVNGYRVREVQRRIAAGDAKAMTMLSLALDAGFASKSTFNVVFKKHTSQTPSMYREMAGL